MPPETVSAYADVLAGLDLADCAIACRRLVETSTFLPSVAEIIAETRRVRRERLRAEQARVDLAEQLEYDRRAIVAPRDAIEAMTRLALPATTQEGHQDG